MMQSYQQNQDKKRLIGKNLYYRGQIKILVIDVLKLLSYIYFTHNSQVKAGTHSCPRHVSSKYDEIFFCIYNIKEVHTHYCLLGDSPEIV